MTVIKGPRCGQSPVTFHTEHSFANGVRRTGLIVTIQLRPDQLPSNPRTQPITKPRNSNTSQHTPGNVETDSDSDIEVLDVRVVNSHDVDDDSDLSSLDGELQHALSSTTTMPTQASQPKPRPPLPARPPAVHPPVLQPNPRVPPPALLHKLLPSIYKPAPSKPSPPPPGYRNIPPNLVNAIQRELNIFLDVGAEDDLQVVGKVVSSLKDPYSASKIRLPVKATTCRHFECFDLENFCVFHKLPFGVKSSLRKSLILKNNEARRLEKIFLMQQRQIAEGSLSFKDPDLVYPSFSEHGQMFFSEVYSKTPPLYKCPLCDEKFGLRQLYISDIFNFFVKTTPKEITKIELVETDRYKIVDDEKEEREESMEVISLSESDSEGDAEDNAEGTAEGTTEGKTTTNTTSTDKGTTPVAEGASLKSEGTEEASDFAEPGAPDRSFTEDFNDGLDDVLTRISQGDGSWNNPVVFD